MELEKNFHEVDAHVEGDKVVEDNRPNFFQKAKEKISGAWSKGKETASKAVDWCRENPDMLAVLLPVLAMGGVAAISDASRKKAEKADYQHSELERYDDDLDMPWPLTRAMTTEEKRYYAARRRRGDNIDDILSDMGLLKK